VSRWYRYQGEEFPSFTTVLRNVLGGGENLINWAARQAAVAAVTEQEWRDLPTGEAIEYLSSAHERVRDTASARGTATHKLIELAHSDPSAVVAETEDEERLLAAWGEFAENIRLEVLGSENAVLNTDLGYGGRYDLLARIRDKAYVLDIKTSKYIHPEAFIQATAYALGRQCAYLEMISRSRNGREVWKVDEVETETIQDMYGVEGVGVLWIKEGRITPILRPLDNSLIEGVKSILHLWNLKRSLEKSLKL
jgi:hypothetical protein